jgi:hypothetical protein
MTTIIGRASLLLAMCLSLASAVVAAEQEKDFVAGKLIQLNDNGAWSWFMDERVVVHEGKLVVGSVRAVKDFKGGQADPDWGNVEIAALDIGTGKVGKTILHRHYEQDDHDGPAFFPLPDKRLLAIYTKHGVERKVYSSISEPVDPLKWSEPKVFETPGRDSPNFRGDNATYSNPSRFPDGKIYNFFRGFDYDPNYMVSDDDGRSWTYGGRFLKGRDGYGPYLKYAFDEKSGTLHVVTTEDHPRNFDNSLYHGIVRDGEICRSDGKPLGKLGTTTDVQLNTWDLTKVFQGDADNVAWMTDVELDRERRPAILFTVQKDGKGKPARQGGMDHRFHLARWDGKSWTQREIAYAGVRLYPGEDDYTGLGAIDPKDPDVVYISTDAHPATGQPLVSAADGKRHHELFRGTSRDGGATWGWEPVTANSTTDNLRPIVPKWEDPRTALVWMRGTYSNNRGAWTTAVVAIVITAKQ